MLLDFAVGVLVVLYGLALCFVLFHSISDAHLIYHYLRSFRKEKKPLNIEGYYPFVTIQLPVYNEVYVVERLIDAVAAISYNPHKLEIQVLDDSTDETSALIERKVSACQFPESRIHSLRQTPPVPLKLIK